MKKVRLAFFMYFSFVAVGMIVSQLIPFINENGYTGVEKNLILGISAILSLCFAIIIGKKSDSEGKMKPSFCISMIGYLLFVFISYEIQHIFVKGIMLIFMIGIVRSVMSCCETIILFDQKQDFAKYHCFGALGSMSGALLSGAIMNEIRVILCCLSGIISMILLYSFQETKQKSQNISLNQMLSLIKNPLYVFVLLLFFFLMMIGFADQYIVVDKMIALKASKQLISIKYAIQSFMEIPVYLGMNVLFKKYKLMNILLFCMLMSFIKFMLYGLSTSTLQIILVSMMQVVTHPLIVIVSKKMIFDITPIELKASSQIVGFAIYFGLSGFVTPMLSQVLLSVWNQNVALYLFSFLNIFPFFIWCLMKKYGKVETGDLIENIFD